MNTQIPMPVNGISTPFSIDENIAKMKQTLLKDIQRSAYVYRVDCGGCNGCEIEIFRSILEDENLLRCGLFTIRINNCHGDSFFTRCHVLICLDRITLCWRSPFTKVINKFDNFRILRM